MSKRLISSVVRIEERDAGWTLVLPADTDTLSLAGEFVARERLCCPFLAFELHVEPHAELAYLQLSGPPGTKALLRAGLVEDC